MTVWALLSYRLQRFEIVALAVGVAVWAVAALVVAWRLAGYDAEFPDCMGLIATTAAYCEDASLQFGPWDQTAEVLLWLVLGGPLLIGVVLGAPIVAREVEDQTAQIAWSFSLSRVRWLIGRILPIAAAGILLFIVLGLAGEILTVARLGGDDPGFQRFDQRGLIVVVRGVVALIAAVLLGAVLGRTLPAILVAIGLTAVLVFGQVVALDAWRRTESTVVDQTSPDAGPILTNAMILEPVAVLQDGTIVSDRKAELPDGVSFDALRIIPSSEYWTWVARETAGLLAISGGLLLTTAVVVRRRRPL